MAEENTDDVRNIAEGDHITVETDEGETLALECVDYSTRNDRDPDTVKEYRTWTFETEAGERVMLQITEGLRRFDWQEEFPHHNPLYNTDAEESLGYITEVQIHGPIPA